MEEDRVAPLVGIVGALGVIAGLAYPYLTVAGPGVGSYYATGAVSPLVAGLLAVVTIVILAAGHERRTDPATAAGVGLAFGVAMVTITLLWGLTARIDTIAIDINHRWIVVAFAAMVPAGSLWYALSLGLVPIGSGRATSGD
ncbi:MAG: hypothetical protein V5A18_08890 [Haloarculaceae archaeon]